MYEEAFNLTSRPFTSMHYVKHYYPAKAISETLETCQAMIDRGAGPVLVIGDHGTGKTLLLAMLEEEFQTSLRVVNLSAEVIRSREDFVQNTLFQLQLNYRGLSENEMRLELVDYLRKNNSTGLLMLIDNAQKLTADVIEEIQPLLDFIHEEQPQVRLVIAGGQGIEDRLADSRLVTFNQRIAGRCFLSCLGCEEVEAYVRSHLIRSAGNPDALFDEESWRAIYEVTEGRPRFINQVCDHALIFSATRGVVPITDSLVREAWFDIQRLPGSVAPSSSGASLSDTPVASQPIESTGEDGWTVLEFGELDGNGESENSDAESDTDTVSFPAGDASSCESEEGVACDASAEQEESDSLTPAAGAGVLAAAMAGFGATQIASPTSSQEEEEFVSPEPTSSDADSSLAQDPFNTYQFDNEEVLTDAYSPYVAQQNQRSLDVTSEQLQNLTPNDESEDDGLDQLSSGHKAEAEAEPEEPEETFPTIESATNPQQEPAREPQRPEVETRGQQETRLDDDRVVSSADEEFEVQQVATDPVEAMPGSGYVPIDPNASASYSTDESEEIAEASGQQGERFVIPAPEESSSDSEGAFASGRDDEADDPEIRRQAEEIIRALRESEQEDQLASGGSSDAASIQQETNAIESTLQNSLAGAAGVAAAATPALVIPGLVSQEESQTEPEVPAIAGIDTASIESAIAATEQSSEQTDSIEPERRILDEVRDQTAMIAPTIAGSTHQDDRDMISMEEQQAVATPEPEPAEMPAWAQKEPSSGEANRVDYQKLFDQLRDAQDQQES